MSPKLLNRSKEIPAHMEVTYHSNSRQENIKKSINVVHFPNGGISSRIIWFLLFLPSYLIGYNT